MNPARPEVPSLSSYQKGVVAILATLQFTIILDFMIISPLGAILMPELQASPRQFGFVVSGYAFSAGISGLLAGSFADRFDRKKLLLFFYTGFILGTLLCGVAPTYPFLLMARIVTGFFGGVVGSIGFAIITDLFLPTMRGRVLGVIQTAFAASQVLGIPAGVYLSNHFGWHTPFLAIVAFGLVLGVIILTYLKPIRAHLALRTERGPFSHLAETLANPKYLQAFATTALLSTGGFMLMPFGSAFSVQNLGLTLEQLPLVYLVTGACSIVAGPLIGRLSDSWGSLRVFICATTVTILMVLIYTHLGVTPLSVVIFISVLMLVGVSARMISSQALISTIPAPADRGAFMSVSSSVQQVSGGIAASIAGWIVVSPDQGPLQNFEVIGFVIVAASLGSVALMFLLARSRRSEPVTAGP
jgi:predicted MFS family arabinose efflux permease